MRTYLHSTSNNATTREIPSLAGGRPGPPVELPGRLGTPVELRDSESRSPSTRPGYSTERSALALGGYNPEFYDGCSAMLGVPSRSVVERGMMGGMLRRGGDIARRVKRRMIEDEGDCERVA